LTPNIPPHEENPNFSSWEIIWIIAHHCLDGLAQKGLGFADSKCVAFA
jgi:hypothetical protein